MATSSARPTTAARSGGTSTESAISDDVADPLTRSARLLGTAATVASIMMGSVSPARSPPGDTMSTIRDPSRTDRDTTHRYGNCHEHSIGADEGLALDHLVDHQRAADDTDACVLSDEPIQIDGRNGRELVVSRDRHDTEVGSRELLTREHGSGRGENRLAVPDPQVDRQRGRY